MTGAPRLRSAFTLIEIIGVLILLSVVSLVAARLFRSTMRVISDAPAAQDAIATTDSMIRQLRADCWGAAQMTVAADGHAEIRLGDGRPVRWEMGDATATRVEGDQIATWPTSDDSKAGRWSFSLSGDVLILRAGEVRLWLPSELAALNRKHS